MAVQTTGANPAVRNVAGFWSDTYNYDPLLASECLSQSAKIAPSLGVLKRGQVLYGPALGAPITTATNLTTSTASGAARCILAADIDTGTGAAVTGLVYTAGNFLDTAMIFSAAGAASDAAQLWQFDIHVMTVLQRSGQLVPMISLPATGGPLPAVASVEDALKREKEQIEAIEAAAGPFEFGDGALPYNPDPAWAKAAYGETEPTAEEKAQLKNLEEKQDLAQEQADELAELEAKQLQERSELFRKQTEARAKTNPPPPPKPTGPPKERETPPPHPPPPPVHPPTKK